MDGGREKTSEDALWLVIDEKNPSYEERFKLFVDEDAAINHAEAVGYESGFGPLRNHIERRAGIMHISGPRSGQLVWIGRVAVKRST